MLYTVKRLQYNISADKLHIFDELDIFIKSWTKEFITTDRGKYRKFEVSYNY